ncbi:hypothetical protein GGE65_005121 [Skermanella aerolata]|uniref:hypothetical protein n=1 Tax=Skermanella aerolata TaxID=393310 RepID=UPI003D1C0B9F
MQIFGPNYEIILFLGFGFLIVSWYGWTLWNSDNIIASIRIAALVIFGFMAFKASFTRHDGHAMMGFGAIFLGTFMLAGWYFSIFGPSAKKTVVYSTIILCFFYTYLGLASHLPAIGIIDHLMQPANSLISNSVANFRNIVSAGSTERRHALTVQYASAMASIRAVHPLPNTKGMVDIFPVDQATVLAHGFDLRSRPVFQSYSVYSSLLIDKNIQFFEGGNAASHIYFKTATIDERFPNLDDGGTWPTLIKWYSFDSLSNDFAVLTRLNVPRSVKLLGISNTQLHFNEPTPIPEYKNNLWVSIKFKHKLAGNLAKIFFKLPTVGIALNYKNGTSSTHRIIPDMTDQGFLLDPPIQSGGDFALMLSGDKVSNSTVKDMEIKGNHWLDWLFVDDITVEFSELQIGELEDEHWRIAADPALAQRAVFNNLIAGAESRDGALPAITNDAGMLQLYAHAPSTMKSEPPEASQLQVKFGIRDGAWQSGKTDGVCFRISGQDEVGITVVIWERCLNPLDVEADRGEQAVTIDLSSYPRKAIVFETDINKTASWDWSYWSAIQFANP